VSLVTLADLARATGVPARERLLEEMPTLAVASENGEFFFISGDRITT
jgi:hypothetical protein